MGIPKPRATRHELTRAVQVMLKEIQRVNERINNLAKSQLEITIVMNALRKKEILKDDDVQEAWDEFTANLEETNDE